MDRSGTREGSRGLLRTYVAGIALLGGVGLAGIDPGGFGRPIEMFLILVALAAVAGARPVRFPWFRVQLTVTHPFIFLAIVQLGVLDALVVALAGLAGTVYAQRSTRRLIRIAFNVGSVVLATLLAAWSFHGLRGPVGGAGWTDFWPLIAAGAVYFLVNTGLLAVAVGLERRQSMIEVWRDGFQWTASSYFAGMSVAAVLLALVRGFGPWSLALGIAPCWLLVAFYETHRENLAQRERRIEEIEALNAGLEIKVAERTQALKDANRKLIEANDQIVEASRAKSEFIANISHELRTPLNAVIGFSEYLAGPDFDNLTARQRGFLADIRDSGEHLLQLINDLLDFAKIEAGKMELREEVVAFAEILHGAVAMLHVAAERKKLSLTSACAPDVGFVEVDPKLVKQVLVNLLSNAVKFTPDGGHVEARARRVGESLVVEVQDDGIGIPVEHLPRIFDEFHQIDGSYARKHQGTGLGLALVRRMVTMHGGCVEVRSEIGLGSTFTCRLPLVFRDGADPPVVPIDTKDPGATAYGAGDLPVAPSGPGDLPAPAHGAGDRPARRPAVAGPCGPDGPFRTAGAASADRLRVILVVDANAISRKLARNMLRSQGYEVLEASSGEEALATLERTAPALILMDVQLPGLDGLEVTRRIKADPRTALIPVVALSAHPIDDDESRAREAGCDGYVAKPIRLATLPAQIAAYLECAL